MSRPSTFSEELAATICDQIIEGLSLRTICKAERMPAPSSIFKWLREHKEFSEQYALAREMQAETLFEDILEIADDGRNDFRMRIGEGGAAVASVDHDHIARSRLRVDARKWMASKLAPKKYGDKVDMSVTGTLQSETDEALDARLAVLLGKAGVGRNPDGAGSAQGDE